MLGVSHRTRRAVFFIISIMFSSISALCYASGDLLVNEQWGLESTPFSGDDSALPSSESPTTGTCATDLVITDGTYTCGTFTAPADGDVDINVRDAWHLVPDSDTEVVIGLIDTGIDYLHPDLVSKVWRNPGELLHIDGNDNGVDDGCEDGVDLDNNGYADDCHGINTMVSRILDNGALNPAAGDPMDSVTGHGTNMAGVMGAVGNNGSNDFHGGIVGVTGFHNNIRILTCAAADLQTDAYATLPGLPGAYGTHDDILACFQYFIDMKRRGVNIVVVNGSGGASRLNNLNNIIIPVGQIRDKYLLNTLAMQDAIDQLAQMDVNVVVAAGNNRWDIDSHPDRAYYPAAFQEENIIAVGAINNQGNPWKYSSYGRWSVDVFAPGERILSTNPRAEISGIEASEYVVSDGSSQATAFVSGMIALARTYPETAGLSAQAMRRLLISSGKALNAIAAKSVSGKLARLVDNNQSGMLNCNNQLFERRHFPRQSSVQVLPGDWFQLEVASYRCHETSNRPYIIAEVIPVQDSFLLMDDGVYPDRVAGDGIYTGQWLARGDLDLYHIRWGVDTVTRETDSIDLHTTIIVDNQSTDTRRSGSWWPTIFRPGFYGGNYRIAYESGERTFTWLPSVSRAGYYEVLAHWPDYSGFTRHAEYTVHHGDSLNPQASPVIADQSRRGGQWNSLGIFWFDAGEFPVELSNRNIDAPVAADAIKLRPVMP
ncbi:MAG: S8 family serine peptidase [Ketobacteraceae bacterium]|nr:S8 family serine peptidase [Ketobacteraceae bacterium]